MNPRSRIAILSHDRDIRHRLEHQLKSKDLHAITLEDASQVPSVVYADPPDVIIIDFSTPDSAYDEILQGLKRDSSFSVIPVIGLISENAVETTSWQQFPVDDFMTHPVNDRELLSRVELCFQRIQRIFDNNPLTKLPGNTSIQRRIEKVLGQPMAVCYVDINNFKPYNDIYGFSRGDEVIRMVARIVSNAVQEAADGGFVGHIGGDDFVFILSMDRAETVCKTIIANFNVIAADLFSDEDKARGCYKAKDRKGVEQTFPLLGISIAVVPTGYPHVQHAGKVAQIAAELKSLAKRSPDSCYVIDRRIKQQ